MFRDNEATKLNVVIMSVTDLDGNEKYDSPYEGLRKFFGYVPLILEGCPMIIMYPDSTITRLTTTKVREYDYNPKTHTHVVRTKNSIYTMKDDYNPTARKRAKARFYTTSPTGRRYKESNPDPQGHLLAYGKYRTKIYAADLPDWYVGGYLYKKHGYISAKGVKHLHYKPNYFTNHLHKDDILFISYDKPIVPISEDGVEWFDGYDDVVSGGMILPFVRAAEIHSGIDAEEIREEIEKKRAWYEQKYK